MRLPRAKDRVRRLVETTDEGAAAELFLLLCRASPELRHWLWEDFGRDPKIRTAFRAQLRRNGQIVRRFAEFSDDGNAWREESRQLRSEIPVRVCGGLTWSQLEKLIASYRAGRLDLGAFLLAHEWRSAGTHAAKSPLLARATVEFFAEAFTTPHLLRQMERAISTSRLPADRSARRAALGYSDWWKLNVLLFILRNPRPSYAIRELRAHLRKRGLNVKVKDLQRFCVRHGIKRDMRAGRKARPADPLDKILPVPNRAPPGNRRGSAQPHKSDRGFG